MAVKTALITGATSGIGKAIAFNLGSNHYNLIITGRRSERLQAIKQELEQNFSIKVHTAAFDIRDRNEVEKFIENLPEIFKNVDVLVNNAGLASGLNQIYNGDMDDWEKMIDTNIKGLLYITRLVTPKMLAQNSGHIINIGSIAGKEVYNNGNVYCATKFAVDAINKALRLELSTTPIRVTSVNPGAVETEFSVVRFHGDEEKAKKVYEGFDSLVAEDIADAVWFAVSRNPHVNINEIIVMPTAQPIAGFINRK